LKYPLFGTKVRPVWDPFDRWHKKRSKKSKNGIKKLEKLIKKKQKNIVVTISQNKLSRNTISY